MLAELDQKIRHLEAEEDQPAISSDGSVEEQETAIKKVLTGISQHVPFLKPPELYSGRKVQ